MKKILIMFVLITAVSSVAFAQSRCLTPEFEQVRKQLYEKYGQPQPRLRLETTDHSVGDTMTFWRWDLSVMPPVWILEPATCRAVTDYSYVFIADDQWNVHIDSADVAQAAYYWEDGTYIDSTMGIYELDTQNFGPPPDMLDNDDHIYILYSGLGSYNGVVFDGYFSIFNEYTEEEAQGMGGHSNEVEMFHMSCYPGNPVSPIRISVLAHEFEHMIHWGFDPNEETWVDEGCAEYAMLLFGVPDPLIIFPDHPDDDLTVWGNQFLDYVQTFMFFTYVADHYGGASTLTDIVAEPQNSIYGIETVLSNLGYTETFADLFVNWTMANYYHGYMIPYAIYDSLYIYFSIDPPNFAVSNVHSVYPVGPIYGNVSRWAADYIVFGIDGPTVLDLEFQGNPIYDYGLAVFPTYIPDEFQAERVFPDSTGYWQHTFWQVGSFSGTAFMVSALGGPTTTSYQYSADITTGIQENSIVPSEISVLSCYPNPFNATAMITYSLSEESNVTISVFNIMGQNIATLSDGIQQGGEHSVVWNADDLPSGVYFVRLSTSNFAETKRMILLK